ncbi:MAG TPA: EthD family reductase [Terracidiphilus sp.]|jgi:uncharacterized protein (TIGR02118 family)
MVKITVLYPNKPGSRFDVEYYLNTHMPLSSRLLGAAIKAVSVEIGRNGVAPDDPPPFAAICGFTCETVEDFMAAFNPVAGDLQGDIPNYTDVTPIIQVSDIRIG